MLVEIAEKLGRATVVSPSNIALLKYWGAGDFEEVIPENISLSMTLRVCHSRCTVEHRPDFREHEILWRGRAGRFEPAPPSFSDRVRAHLNRLSRHYGCSGAFRVATENSFPSAAGLASSASGFSALTLAVIEALGKQASPAGRSELSRLSGSGSACRSVVGGFVQWPEEGGGNFAQQLWPAEHWDLRDVIAVVEMQHKEVSSLEGHRRARTSPYFETRLKELPRRFETMRDALANRDLETLGPLIEAEAVDLHCIAMTSSPPVFYWKPSTLQVLETIRHLRSDGVPAWMTMDAGANVHVICEPAAEDEVAQRLTEVEGVLQVIRDGVGPGPRIESEHLPA